MSRLRYNNVGDLTGSVNPITISSATTTACSWTSAPANLQTKVISLPDYLVLVIEPGTTNEEVVWLVGYAPGATTGLILRKPSEASVGTPITHTAVAWLHGPTQHDFRSPTTRRASSALFT